MTKEVRRDPEGGWLSKREESLWMFTFLFEKSSRAQVQSVRKHNHLVANWAVVWTNQAMITDDRGEKWRGAGSSNFEGSGENVNVIPFLLKKWEYSPEQFLPPPPQAFSPFLHPGQRSWLREGCGQLRLWLTSTISGGVGQAWPGIDWRENPFSSAEGGLHRPSSPHDNLHLPVESRFPASSARFLTPWDGRVS